MKGALVAAALLAAAMASRAGPVESLKEFVRDVRSGRAEFTQTVTSPDGKKKKSSTGSFEFSRPNRFRFAYLKSQGEPNYIEGILEGGTLDGDEGSALDGAPGGASGENDPMYDQAVGIVLQHRRASISLVQRHLRIGYNRAARLLEQMEKSGLVTGMATNGNRDILVPARAE